jgi:hypothetical protein
MDKKKDNAPKDNVGAFFQTCKVTDMIHNCLQILLTYPLTPSRGPTRYGGNFGFCQLNPKFDDGKKIYRLITSFSSVRNSHGFTVRTRNKSVRAIISSPSRFKIMQFEAINVPSGETWAFVSVFFY